MGSGNGKNCLSVGHLSHSSQVLSKFPFVNLQIKSIVESLRPIKSCTHSMKKISDIIKNMHFWVKNRFSEILKFLRICWSDLVDSIGFFEAVDMNELPILSRNYFNWPFNLKNIFNFEN